MCVVVSEAVGYLNALKLGRRVFESAVLDGGGSRDDVVEAVVDSNMVMIDVL